jgi:hypothetical protein
LLTGLGFNAAANLMDDFHAAHLGQALREKVRAQFSGCIRVFTPHLGEPVEPVLSFKVRIFFVG